MTTTLKTHGDEKKKKKALSETLSHFSYQIKRRNKILDEKKEKKSVSRGKKKKQNTEWRKGILCILQLILFFFLSSFSVLPLFFTYYFCRKLVNGVCL